MIRWILIAIVFGFVGYTIAGIRGRNQLVWAVLCALVPLLIVALLILPKMVVPGMTKKCPNCAEVIKAEAKVCKHCGSHV